MLYLGQFKNYKDEDIYIEIVTNNDRSSTYELLLSGDPLTITQSSSDIFSPIKPLSATIRIKTQVFLPDLYTTEIHGVKVTVRTDSYTLFEGYLTPCVYTQDWNYLDDLELECVSSLSTLGNIDYEVHDYTVQSWKSIIDQCVSQTGVYDKYCFIRNLFVNGSTTKYRFIIGAFQNELNFIDDDDESSRWTCKEVLEEICTILGVSLVEWHGELFFVDYERAVNGYNIYDEFTIGSDTYRDRDLSSQLDFRIIKDSYRAGGNTISMDDVFGRVNINCNLYPVESSAFDIFNEDDLVCIHPGMDYYECTIPHVVNAYSRDREYFEDADETIHRDLYRFYVNKKFIHYAYPVTKTVTNGVSNWTLGEREDINANPTYHNFESQFIDGYLRTHVCCYIVKHMEYSTPRNLASSDPDVVRWEDCLIISYGLGDYEIFNKDDLYSEAESKNLTEFFKSLSKKRLIETRENVSIPKMVLPVPLEERKYEGQVYKTYLRSKGGIQFLKYPLLTKCDKWKKLDKTEGIADDTYYTHVGNSIYTIEKRSTDYDGAFDMVSGSTWSVQVPNSKGEGHNLLYNWNNLVDRTQMSMHVMESNANYTELDYVDSKLVLSCTVPVYGQNLVAPNFALIKDVECVVDREYPIDIWLSGEIPNDDLFYTNTDTQANSFLEDKDVDIKINTQTGNREISLSSIITRYADNTGKYRYEYAANTQFYSGQLGKDVMLEEDLLRKYTNHFTHPKIIYETFLDRNMAPYKRVELKQAKWMGTDKILVIDSYEFDVKADKTNYKLIEY